MLPFEFPLEIVRDVIDEMKEEWFTRRIEFERVFTTTVGIAVHGRRDTLGLPIQRLGDAEGGGNTTVSLVFLQQRFHDRLQEEIQTRRVAGTIPVDTPDVRNIVPWFPHISLAYTERGQEEGVQDIQARGWYSPPVTSSNLLATPEPELKRSSSSTFLRSLPFLNKKKNKETKATTAQSPEVTNIKLGGFEGYKVGAIFFAYCGGLRPEKWDIFERIEETGERVDA